MELIDNINRLLGEDLKQTIQSGARLKIAASCFSMYAFEALKAELEKVDELNFVFTSPTFVASQVADKIRKERREFHIPKLNRERSLYGSEFEIRLRNKLTQRAVARECADWIRRKATFKSSRTQVPMQQFACVQAGGANTVYTSLYGFTAVDLGGLYEQLLQRLIPFPARPQETLAELIERVEQAQAKQRDVDKMPVRPAKEKQFNRKVEINAQLRQLKKDHAALIR